MWPFRKKQPAQEQKPSLVDSETSLREQSRRISQEFANWRPLGSSFYYLGNEMVVTAHCKLQLLGFAWITIPCIIADYKDGFGIIRSFEFDMDQVKAMMAADKKNHEN